MKKIALLLALLAVNTGAAAETLNKRNATRLVQNFYDTLKSRDDKKLNTLIADNAVINIKLLKMQQSFTLDKASYLQHIKAAWHFAKDDTYDVKDLQYKQAGLAATVTFTLNESRFILGETVSQDETVEIALTKSDNDLKISSIHIQTSF